MRDYLNETYSITVYVQIDSSYAKILLTKINPQIPFGVFRSPPMSNVEIVADFYSKN